MRHYFGDIDEAGYAKSDDPLAAAYRRHYASFLLKHRNSLVRDAFSGQTDHSASLRAVRLLSRGVHLQVEGSVVALEFDRFDKADRAVCGFDSSTTEDRTWLELQSLVVESVTIHRDAKLFGISVAFFSQIVPTLLLCRLIRERLPAAQIILGGPQIAMWHVQLRQMRATRTYVDYLCIGQGEPTLEALAQLLFARGGDVRDDFHFNLATVPNLVYRAGGDFIASTVRHQVALEDLPPPDLHLLASSRYFNNEIQIPITSCVGCYWGRCTFCSYGNRFHRDKAYDQLSPLRLAEVCAHQLRQHPTRRINFVDENTNLRLVLSAARLLRQRGIAFAFSTRNRLEPSLLDIQFCRALRDAGCVMMSVGYETNSQRLLDALDKGLDASTFQVILRNLDEVGIDIRMSVIVGALDETPAERQTSLAFLKVNEDLVGIDSFQFLAVEPGSFLHERSASCQKSNAGNAVLTLNNMLSYGMGRAGLRSEFDLLLSRELVVEELAEFQSSLRPVKNDEFPSVPLLPGRRGRTVHRGQLKAVALHPWVSVERVGGTRAKRPRLVLFDLLSQRLYQLTSSSLHLYRGALGKTLLSNSGGDDGSRALSQLVSSGLATQVAATARHGGRSTRRP